MLLMEDSTGRKSVMRVIACSLPDAMFSFAVEAEQRYEEFPLSECGICPRQSDEGICRRPIETFNSEDEEMIRKWESRGDRHEQRTIRELT